MYKQDVRGWMQRLGGTFVLGLLLFGNVNAQGTAEDYQRANKLGDKLYHGVHDVPFDITWQMENRSVLYTVNR